MGISEIVIQDFKDFFTRDFAYYEGSGCSKESVTDADITRAYLEASMCFNEDLFSNQDKLKVAYLYLAAHYICVDAQIAAQGTTSVGYNQVSSRAVGNVSESYQIPEWASKNPILSAFMTTRYGQQYLAIICPLIIGGVAVYQGATTA